MDITIYLSNGMQLDIAGTEFNAAEFEKTYNAPGMLACAIGDTVVSKHTIQMIVPTNEEVNPNVTVYTTTNAGNFNLAVENYSVQEVTQKMNVQNNLLIAIGNSIFNKGIIGMVAPITPKAE